MRQARCPECLEVAVLREGLVMGHRNGGVIKGLTGTAYCNYFTYFLYHEHYHDIDNKIFVRLVKTL